MKFKNHLNADIEFDKATFEKLIDEDPSRCNLVEHLADVVGDPNEIWMNELKRHPGIITYKYIKFYKQGAIFVITDLADPFEQILIDFYFISSNDYIHVDGEKQHKIDTERIGILTKSNL